MRGVYFVFFLLLPLAEPAHAETPPLYASRADTEIAALYKSCVESLTAAEEELERNYCYQTISAMYPSIYAMRLVLATVPEDDEKDCEKKKFAPIKDIHEIPPPNAALENFSQHEIASNFVAFVENGGAVQEFPLLTSSADRALAQSILNWSKNKSPQQDEAAREKTRLAVKRAMDSGNKPDHLDLIHSCEKNLQGAPQNNLCSASISGFLIVYSLAKKHPLPAYPQSGPCHREKNDFLKQFTKNRLGCFPENTDLKKQSASEITRRWSPEMETRPIEKRSTAAYYAASVLSSYYSCKKQPASTELTPLSLE